MEAKAHIIQTDCPANCAHGETINRLNQREMSVQEGIADIRADLKELKVMVNSIGKIELDHEHTKTAVSRAFSRIENIEASVRSFDAFINQVIGMKNLSYVLWAILTSGMGLMLFKLFSMPGVVH